MATLATRNNNTQQNFGHTAAKHLAYVIERKEEPIIVVLGGVIVAYNQAAEKAWENVVEDLNQILGEEVENVCNKYDLDEDQKCFYSFQ